MKLVKVAAMNLRNLHGYTKGDDGLYRLRQTFDKHNPGSRSGFTTTILVRDRDGNFLRSEKAPRNELVNPK